MLSENGCSHSSLVVFFEIWLVPLNADTIQDIGRISKSRRRSDSQGLKKTLVATGQVACLWSSNRGEAFGHLFGLI